MKYLTEHVKRASYNHNNSITRVYIQGDGGPVRAEHGAHGAALRAEGHRALPAAALQLQRPGGHPGRWRGARETQQTSGDRMFFKIINNDNKNFFGLKYSLLCAL